MVNKLTETLTAVSLALALGGPANSQTPTGERTQDAAAEAAAASTTSANTVVLTEKKIAPAEALFPNVEKDIKFKLADFAKIISSKNHEDWRLVAYPDPSFKTTGVVDVGAGFNLSIKEDKVRGEAGDKYQYNGRVRKEPSSLTLWKAAGLEEGRLTEILARFNERIEPHREAIQAHKGKKLPLPVFNAFKKLNDDPTVPRDITHAEGEKLLMISVRHAAHNAMGYAKDFPNMSASQQMAMTMLVYQMGSNFEAFEKTLAVLNDTSYLDKPPGADRMNEQQLNTAMNKQAAAHFGEVQSMLRHSFWHKDYNPRAKEVVAKLGHTPSPIAQQADTMIAKAPPVHITARKSSWREKAAASKIFVRTQESKIR